jgi:hypothetical protein
MNLSLQLNTLGTFQLIKALIMPLLAGIEIGIYKLPVRSLKLAILAAMTVGVGMATVKAESGPLLGLLVGIFGVVMTAAK